MRSRLWDIAAAAVVVAVVVAHVSFLLADGRLPRDPGLYYRDLPGLYDAWSAGDLGTVLRGLGESSGWYNALIGLTMAVVGIHPLAFSLFDALWVGLSLLSAGLIARRLHSPAAGLAAVCLVGAMPVIFLVGRSSWIHTPETTLILGMLAAWVHDPTLTRRRTAAGLAVLGALAVALRPSGAVWVATLVPLLVAQGPRRWLRIAAVAVVWAGSLAVPFANAEQYMLAKAAARERYATHLPELAIQVFVAVGHLPLMIAGVGLAAGLVSFARSRPRLSPPAVLLSGWVVLSLVLWMIFQAGLDNFPLIAPALGILGAWGLARLAKPLALLAVPVFLVIYTPQWLPVSVLQPLQGLPGTGQYVQGSDIRNRYRVYQRYGWTDLQALLQATCPDRPCILAVDQGLLEPFSEDIGTLELFLVGARQTQLVGIRMGRVHESLPLDALIEFNCEQGIDLQWRDRYPDSIANLATIINGLQMTLVWSRSVNSLCEVMWMTPSGQIADPDALPSTGVQIQTTTVEGFKPPLPGDPPLPDQQ